MLIVKYLKSLLYVLISILLFAIIIATLNYFNIFTTKLSGIFELIAMIVSMFIGGFYLGKNSNKKGFLEGIKIALLMIVILFVFSYLAFDQGLHLSLVIYYAVILISAILGSIVGINKKSSSQ